MSILLDVKSTLQSVAGSLDLFKIFVGVIGFISLTLAFFLLVVSTTSNIRENVWEYGCLRAIGVST
jgi:ABC-type antimicrobial peptide transport system permease subunit